MGLETTASLSTIQGLHINWPESTEPFSECDDHLVNIKLATFRTFPNVNSAVATTSTEFGFFSGYERSVTGQASAQNIGALADLSASFLTDVDVGDKVVLSGSRTSSISLIISDIGIILTDSITVSASEIYTIITGEAGLSSNAQTQLNSLVTNRQAMSESVNVTLQASSASIFTQIQTMSNAVQASIHSLSATLNATLLGTSQTAADAINWGNAALYEKSDTPASPATNSIWFQHFGA